MSQRKDILEKLIGGGALTQKELAGKKTYNSIDCALKTLVKEGLVLKSNEIKPATYKIGNIDTAKLAIKKEEEKEKAKIIVKEHPQIEDILAEHTAVHEDLIYGKEEELIREIFSDEKYKYNIDKLIVAMKIAVIDLTNSTQLSHYKEKLSLDGLASVILSIQDFDKRVKIGDPTLVEDILSHKELKYNLFSFASKYCCYQNYFGYKRNDYSIYDKVLEKHLPQFVDSTSREIRKLRDKKKYKEYNDLIGNYLESQKFYCKDKKGKPIEINGYDGKTHKLLRREFDHYVWNKYNQIDKNKSKKKKKEKKKNELNK